MKLITKTLPNIRLGPLLPGSGKSKMKFGIFPLADPMLGHLQMRRGDLVSITEHVMDEALTKVNASIPGVSLYAGPLMNHFGHFIAESLHRLWPIFSSEEFRSANIVYHCLPHGTSYVTQLSPWMKDILETLGVDTNRIVFIDKPMMFDSLTVAAQGSVLGGGVIGDGYERIFPPQIRERKKSASVDMERPSRFYLSRSRHLYSGSFLGEKLLERYLKEYAGFEVVYPEDLLPSTLLELVKGADAVIASEGSALHVLELCPKLKMDVFVVCRRDPRAVEKRIFGPVLQQKCRRSAFSKRGTTIVPLDWEPATEIPAWQNASTVLDMAQLFKDLNCFFDIKLPQPTKEEVKQAYQESLLALILDPRSTRKSTTTEKLGHLLQLLRRQVAELEELRAEDPVPTEGRLRFFQ